MPKRLYLKNFFPPDVCKELEFIHKSCGVAGYRPFVLSTTLLHLIATNCAPLIMPFIPIRDRIKEIIEEHYGCEYELFVEFTGLISWTKGAKIGWHSDNDRPYLKQRHFTALCYLSTQGCDFEGGFFHFQEGEHKTIVPELGDVLIYRSEDVHCVDEITAGERCTLALWFTLDNEFDEDVKILKSLTNSVAELQSKQGQMPIPAASSMYLFDLCNEVHNESSTTTSDIRTTRAAEAGYEFCTADNKAEHLDDCGGTIDALFGPVKLKLNDYLVPHTFCNSIHALQVVYFSLWRGGNCEPVKNVIAQQESRCDEGTSNLQMQDYAVKEPLLDKYNLLYDDWEQYTVAKWYDLKKHFSAWKQSMCISAL